MYFFDLSYLEKFKSECRRILKPDGWVVALYNNGDTQDAEVVKKATHRLEATQQFFNIPMIKEFRHRIPYDRSTWQSFMLSHSYSPIPGDENYEAFIGEINQIFEVESKDGVMDRKLVTRVYAEQLD